MNHRDEVIYVVEILWNLMPEKDRTLAIDKCLMRAIKARSPWANQYWHGVAQVLGEKYCSEELK